MQVRCKGSHDFDDILNLKKVSGTMMNEEREFPTFVFISSMTMTSTKDYNEHQRRLKMLELLRKQIERLETFHSQTSTKGNSAAGIIYEVSEFMRYLPELIDNLKQVEVDLVLDQEVLEMQNDHSGNCSH